MIRIRKTNFKVFSLVLVGMLFCWGISDSSAQETDAEFTVSASWNGHYSSDIMLKETQSSFMIKDAQSTENNDQIVIYHHTIKAEKRDDYERLVKDLYLPALEQVKHQSESEPLNNIQYIEPTEPNENGTYTYLFIGDPYDSDFGYAMTVVMNPVYGAERAKEYIDTLYMQSIAEEQVTYIGSVVH